MGKARKAINVGTYTGRIAARIRELRDKNGVSVVDLYETVKDAPGVRSLEQFKQWERGASPIHVNAIPALAEALGVKISKLLPKE